MKSFFFLFFCPCIPLAQRALAPVISLQPNCAEAAAGAEPAHCCGDHHHVLGLYWRGSLQVVRKAGQARECFQASCFAQFSSKAISLYHRKLPEWPELQSKDLKASMSVGVEIKSSCFRAQAKLERRGQDGNFPLSRLRYNFQKGF